MDKGEKEEEKAIGEDREADGLKGEGRCWEENRK